MDLQQTTHHMDTVLKTKYLFIPVLDQFDSSAVMLKYWTEYEESMSFRNSKNILLNLLQYIFHAWKQTSY